MLLKSCVLAQLMLMPQSSALLYLLNLPEQRGLAVYPSHPSEVVSKF